jgi:hypothetical protein
VLLVAGGAVGEVLKAAGHALCAVSVSCEESVQLKIGGEVAGVGIVASERASLDIAE